MDWDRLQKRIEDDDFQTPKETWVPNVMKFVHDYIVDLVNKRNYLVSKSLKVAELKAMIKVTFDLPDVIIEMMQANVDKMEMTEIETHISQYKAKYEMMKLQYSIMTGESSSSTESQAAVPAIAPPPQSVDVPSIFSAVFRSNLNVNTNTPLSLSQPDPINLTYENFCSNLQQMSEGEKFNFAKQWFITAIIFIKCTERELSRLQ